MKVTILGAGAWGSVFGEILRDAGLEVRFWSVSSEELVAVRARDFETEPDITLAVQPAQIVVIALVAAALEPVLKQLADTKLAGKKFISLTKGLSLESLHFPSEIVKDILPVSAGQIFALSGPSLASELKEKLPTGAMLAGVDLATAEELASQIRTDYFRLWATDDVRGVEVAGVYKNILAIAVGAARAAGQGSNFTAVLTTQGLGEMANFAQQLGARKDTFYTVAGIGDLLTTAYSDLSRNQTLGRLIVELGSANKALAATTSTVEGYHSAAAIAQLAANQNIDTPIASLVNQLLNDQLSVDDFLSKLTTLFI